MKLELTVEPDDIKEAICDWVAKQPHLKPFSEKIIFVSYTGGSMFYKDGKIMESPAKPQTNTLP